MILNKAKPKTTPSTPKSSFATAPGGPKAGQKISAPGNVANAKVIAANKASGGTTTSTYRDKYTDKEGGPGASALQAAAVSQAQGFAKIFDKVNKQAAVENAKVGKAAPKASTYNMALPNDKDKVIKIEGTNVSVVPKEKPVEKKTIVSPAQVQDYEDLSNPISQVVTTPSSMPLQIDTYSLTNRIAPLKGGLPGAASLNQGTAGINQRAILSTPSQIGQNISSSVQSFIGNLITQLGPGITARVSAKSKR
jgi:hypothetical protein